MECAVHIWDVKNFPLDSTALSLRKHRENEVWEWSFIYQLYLATLLQARHRQLLTARLNFPHRRLTFGFFDPEPASEASNISEKAL